jgi:restriction system protein
MLPLLEIIANGDDHRLRDITQAVADRLKLTDEQREERLPSGEQTIISNRVAWAKTYLKKAGLVANPVRGLVRITEEGRRVLAKTPARIDAAFLRQYESFRGFINQSNTDSAPENEPEAAVTPEEAIEQAYQTIENDLADELLEKVKACSPRFFEELVVDLLVKMGYGGSLADAGQAIGRSGDDGIDGIIKADRLGLDVLCIQAKRWEGTVGRPVVQAFAGSMEGQRAKKGVLLTTSSFTKDAEEYVNRIERKIVLIDGRRLAGLMIEHNVGVVPHRSIVIKKVDQDYFDIEGV